MSYTLDNLAADIHAALKAEPGRDGKLKACGYVERALKDDEFVSKHLLNRPADADQREILYEDPELGFCICGHAYGDKAYGSPHDHGTSWAIYGQARGVTEMTDWRIVDKGDGDRPTVVVPERTYDLEPGMAHFYDVGDVHSPKREKPTMLIRIEGANLDNVKRSNIKAKS